MRYYACTACRHLYIVVGKPEELELLGDRQSFPCVTPLCRAWLQAVSPRVDASKFECLQVSVQDFYRGVHGFGTPGTPPATLDRFLQVLTTKRIVGVVATPIGTPERVILHELTLEGGTKLHFDTSANGACCYYIEEAPDAIRVDDPAGFGDPGREEAGRVAEADAGGRPDEAGTAGQPGASQLAYAGPVPPLPEAGEVRPDDPE